MNRRHFVANLSAALGLLGLFTCSCGMLGQVTQDVTDAGQKLAFGGAKAAAAATLPIGIEEEVSYGGAISVMVVQRYGGLVDDPAVHGYINLLGQALALHAQRPNLAWHFAVLDSPQVNALSAPGGYVFVTKGALLQMTDEAQLAGVLAHEIGHVDARHALESIKALKAKSALAQGAADAWKDSALFGQLLDTYLGDFFEHGLPVAAEFEADALGTGLLMRVGWYGAGLRDFLAILGKMEAQADKPTTAQFEKTHPKTADRISKLEEQLKRFGDFSGSRDEARLRAVQAKARSFKPAPPAQAIAP